MIDESLIRRRALREMKRALARGDIDTYTRAALSYAIEGDGDIFERLEELGIPDDELVPDDPACKAALRLVREMRRER